MADLYIFVKFGVDAECNVQKIVEFIERTYPVESRTILG